MGFKMTTKIKNRSKIGKTFGRLFVVDFAGVKYGHSQWLCKCDCGNEVVVDNSNLGRNSNSCGCLAKQITKERSITHGKRGTRIYAIWQGMKQRCTNKKMQAYKYYGGRGIKVCERWLKFENFYEDMGERPEGKSLDRIDNDGDYCKENCRWATIKEQMNNTRYNTKITFKGKTMNVNEWEKKLNMSSGAIRGRLKRGWSIEKTLTTPKIKGRLKVIK